MILLERVKNIDTAIQNLTHEKHTKMVLFNNKRQTINSLEKWI